MRAIIFFSFFLTFRFYFFFRYLQVGQFKVGAVFCFFDLSYCFCFRTESKWDKAFIEACILFVHYICGLVFLLNLLNKY